MNAVRVVAVPWLAVFVFFICLSAPWGASAKAKQGKGWWVWHGVTPDLYCA